MTRRLLMFALAILTLAASLSAQSLSILHHFGAQNQGIDPGHTLAVNNGVVYGTALGGTSSVGVVYSVTTTGTFNILHTFTGGSADGEYGNGVMYGADGNLYGTAQFGGGTSLCFAIYDGCGLVYRLDPSTKEFTILHIFTGGDDGALPFAALSEDGSGNLYGTTASGGNSSCQDSGFPGGCGVIFEITAAGEFSVLYSFADGDDGKHPESAPALDGSGNLYGTTFAGGNYSCNPSTGYGGCGTVWELAGGVLTTLYTFAGGTDGATPAAGVTLSGNTIYGTTEFGGQTTACASNPVGCGTVWEISGGVLSVLHQFDSLDGAYPDAGVTLAGGTLYGTAYAGGQGKNGTTYGVIWQVKSGAYGVIHFFNSKTDGENPASGLTADESGNLFGTTYYGGGTNGRGTVFERTP